MDAGGNLVGVQWGGPGWGGTPDERLRLAGWVVNTEAHTADAPWLDLACWSAPVLIWPTDSSSPYDMEGPIELERWLTQGREQCRSERIRTEGDMGPCKFLPALPAISKCFSASYDQGKDEVRPITENGVRRRHGRQAARR